MPDFAPAKWESEDSLGIYVPSARERVRVSGWGHTAVFLVVEVDQETQTVDLMPLAGETYGLQGVPFGLLRPYREDDEKRNTGAMSTSPLPLRSGLVFGIQE